MSKSSIGKRIFLLGIIALVGLGCWHFFSHLPPLDQAVASIEGQETITEIASSYYGTLSRPLLPQTSLGLPFFFQCLISLAIALGMIFIYKVTPRARKLVIFLTVLTVVRHLMWRGFETLDLTSPISTTIGLVIYGAEILAFFAMVLGYFQIYSQSSHDSINLKQFLPEQLPTVDVLVCTYNEPVSVLYRTLVGCQSMDYPKKKVYLLDDGNRPEMADLARKLGVYYITREQNIHAKAGNMNNALVQTNGELVLVFDADHVPCKSFLQEVVGFFVDEKLAYVQTPQHFFTQDPFQRNLVAGEVVNNEQDLFFHVIQPGNDYWGAAFFAGSGAIFRRVSLNEIGGFAVETITEDVHTGLRLHARGWKSLYYNKDLAAGFAQDSFADFIKQRLRWARGMTQVLFYDNPLLVRGLTMAQRICYFAGIWYFFHGLPRLIFLVAPLCFLLFGFKTVNAGFLEVLVYYLPSFLCLFLGYSLISKGIRQSFWSEVYETALCVYLMMTTFFTCLSPKRAKFRVTPKGTTTDKLNFNLSIVFPQVIIASLIIVGVGMGIVRMIYTPEYVGGIYTNLFWSLYNLVLLFGAIYVAQERPQLRIAPRIFKRVRCELRLLDGSIAVGYTTNISESGIALVFEHPIPVTGTVALKLLDWDIEESSVFSVQAVRSTVDTNNRHYIGFRIVNRTEIQHQKLIRHMFGNPDVWADDYVFTKPTQSFFNLMFTPLRLTGTSEKATKRRAIRFQSTLSCVVELEGQYLIGMTDEISETGLSLYLKEARSLYLNQALRIRIQWANGQVSDVTAQVIRIEDTGGGQGKIAMNFVNLSREQRLDLIRQIYQSWENLVRVAPSINKTVPCIIKRANGESLQGFSQEISEMGVVVNLQTSITFEPDEEAMVQLFWDEQTASTYPGIFANTLERPGASTSTVLIYFQNLSLSTLEALSEKLHEPIESHTFNTLNAV